MKNVAQELLTHISQEVITVALCCRMTAKSTEVRLTEHDENLEINNAIYSACNCINFGPIHHGRNSITALVEITECNAVSKVNLMNGQCGRVEVELFLVNYENISQGAITLFVGTIGGITIDDNKLKISLEGAKNALHTKVGTLFSPHCRAQFCDGKCKLDREKFTFQGSVSKVVNYLTLEDAALPDIDGYYKHGVITFLEGSNRGVSVGVRDHVSHVLYLLRSTPHPVLPGDAYSIIAGCDKNFLTCSKKFNNTRNFRGEPHIPDLNSIYQPTEA
ncbi:DUF2163 domain-containing protein [Anaplasma capra]|uniref:DUF2163 domain-containing protein n=1 Tax=Anaplasma capra TaxID=1562740 RepID=UPI0021D58ED0|nr:DUF2163 domain-containing protein [Anaplasma capra]MCU7611420.1 DUF2163 domain-containing protein [Anaplasma capra]MCU7612141.1 DUF2163 domain-containing protein [Anaplasma capra]